MARGATARRWADRHARLVAAILAVVGLIAVALVALPAFVATNAGRALIVRALPLFAPKSGLRVTAGRIDGDVFGALRIHDLALADPAGVFARVPLVDLDWRPLTLFEKRLTLRSVAAPEMAVLRRPRLRPSAGPAPVGGGGRRAPPAATSSGWLSTPRPTRTASMSPRRSPRRRMARSRDCLACPPRSMRRSPARGRGATGTGRQRRGWAACHSPTSR